MTAPTGNRGRGSFDPFAPGAPGFPDRRLRRAGVDDDTLTRLRGEYAEMGRDDQQALVRFVARHPDTSIRERFQGSRRREELEEMTINELVPLLRERNLSTAHDRKAELVDRLMASYEGAVTDRTTQAPLEAAVAPPAPDSPATAPEAASGSDTAQTGAPAADAPQTAAVTAPATQAPGPQTPDATPAPATTATAADTTTEETTRG